MKVLIIDRDRMATQFLRTKIEAAGHEVIEEAVKNNALELLGQGKVEAVFFDPAPLSNARPLVLGIRRSMESYPYVVMMSHSLEHKDAIMMGANTILNKPLDANDLDIRLENAQRLTSLIDHMADNSTDFPSAGGIIAKSAFNQLFRAAIDRADRYGEQAFILLIKLENYDEIKDIDGPYAAEYAVSKLAQQLGRLRRQSDIIAQIDDDRYALLLQRPLQEDEPIEAAKRFAQALDEQEDVVSNGTVSAEKSIQLTDLPVGNSLYTHRVTRKDQSVQSSG